MIETDRERINPIGIDVATAILIGKPPVVARAGTTMTPPPTPVRPIKRPVTPLNENMGQVEMMALIRVLNSAVKASNPAVILPMSLVL